MKIAIEAFVCPSQMFPGKAASAMNTQSIQADITVIPPADVPREDAVTVAGGWRLGKGTGTRNTALAGVEPVSRDMLARNVCHE
jgi:hypothetical protein